MRDGTSDPQGLFNDPGAAHTVPPLLNSVRPETSVRRDTGTEPEAPGPPHVPASTSAPPENSWLWKAVQVDGCSPDTQARILAQEDGEAGRSSLQEERILPAAPAGWPWPPAVTCLGSVAPLYKKGQYYG